MCEQEEMMSVKEKSTMIRLALKKAGFNARQVSVKADCGGYELAFYVTIRDRNIDKAEVEKVVLPFSSIDYDEHTGEILTGGNDYIFVRYAA